MAAPNILQDIATKTRWGTSTVHTWSSSPVNIPASGALPVIRWEETFTFLSEILPDAHPSDLHLRDGLSGFTPVTFRSAGVVYVTASEESTINQIF